MKFNLFKRRKHNCSNQNEDNLPVPINERFNVSIELYDSIQPYESEDFSPFDEDYFAGENYEAKKKRVISDPKTSPSFFLGFLFAAISVAVLCASSVFFTLFYRFSGTYTQIEIPKLSSLSESDALKLLDNYDCFNYTVEYQDNPNAPEGSVVSQYPAPHSQKSLFSASDKINIKLTVNKKSNPITLPSLLGQEARIIALELKNAGINVKIKEAFSETVKAGRIISASHKKGSKIYRGATVTLTKSIGKPIQYLSVPDVLGYPESEAISILQKGKFEISDISYKSSHYPAGLVIEQSLSGGESVREGSKISLTVSIGKQKEQ